MTIKQVTSDQLIVMILFWFYFSGLSRNIIRKKIVDGDWSQSMASSVAVLLCFCVGGFVCDCLSGIWFAIICSSFRLTLVPQEDHAWLCISWVSSRTLLCTIHFENTPIQIYRKFYLKSQIKSCDIFHSSAQNIDFGYSLEPPRRGGSNEYP